MDIKNMTPEQKVKAFVKKNFKDGKIKFKLSDFPPIAFSTIYYRKDPKTKVKNSFYHTFVINDNSVVTTKNRPTFWNAKNDRTEEKEGYICLSTGVYFKLAYFKGDEDLEVMSFTQIWLRSKVNKPMTKDDLEIFMSDTYMLVKGTTRVFTKDREIDVRDEAINITRSWKTWHRDVDGWHGINHFDQGIKVCGFDKYLTELSHSTTANMTEFKKMFPDNTWVSATGGVITPNLYSLSCWWKGYKRNTERISRDHKTPKEKLVCKLLSEVHLSDNAYVKELMEKAADSLQVDYRCNYNWLTLDKDANDEIKTRGMISEISNGYVILRVFSVLTKIERKHNYWYSNSFRTDEISKKEIIGEPVETARIYLSEAKDSFILGMAYDFNNNTWVPMNSNIVEEYNNTPICNPENIKNSVKVQYILEMCMGYTAFLENRRGFKDIQPDILSLAALFAAVKHPIAEQMYKAGYKYVSYELLGAGSEDFQENFLGYKRKIKPGELFKKIDMNKFQLSFLEKCLEENTRNHNAIFNYNWAYYGEKPYMFLFKLFSGVDNFKGLDNDTSRYAMISTFRYFLAFSHLYECDIANNTTHGYRDYKERNLGILNHPEKAEWLKIIAKIAWKESKEIIGEEENRIFKTARDTVRSYHSYLDLVLGYGYRRIDNNLQELEERNNILILDFSNVTCYNDIVRLHDAMVALVNNTRQERNKVQCQMQEENNKKFLKKRKELFEYSDDEYMIRVPEKLEEIAKEGMTLAHCVAGYVTSVANGQTNIVFLRKKSAPMEPFYTIEVRNSRLIQVHGYRNKHLGLNPEAVPFVLRWLRDKNITYSDSQVLDTGAGYSPNNILIPKPVI